MKVGEVAAPPAGHQDLLADLVRSFENQNASATLSCHKGAHKARCTTAKNDNVVSIHAGNIAGLRTLHG